MASTSWAPIAALSEPRPWIFTLGPVPSGAASLSNIYWRDVPSVEIIVKLALSRLANMPPSIETEPTAAVAVKGGGACPCSQS